MTPEEATRLSTATTIKYGESLAQTAILTAAAGVAVSRFGDSTRRFADTAIKASAALVATATATVALANPAAVYRFQLALRDLGAVIGRILTPVLETATALVRTLADAVMNLPPGLKEFLTFAGQAIVVVGAAALVFKVVTGALGLVASAVAYLTTALTALTSAASAAAVATTAQAAATGTAAVAAGGATVGLMRFVPVLGSVIAGTAIGTAQGGSLFGSAAGAGAGTAVGGFLGSFLGPVGTFIGMAIGGALGGSAGGRLTSKDGKSSVGTAVAPAQFTSGDELYRKQVTQALMSAGPGGEDVERSILRGIMQVVENTRRDRVGDRSERLLTGRQ